MSLQGRRPPIDPSRPGGRLCVQLASLLNQARAIAAQLNDEAGGFVDDHTDQDLFFGSAVADADCAQILALANGTLGELNGHNVYQVNVGAQSYVNQFIQAFGQ